MSLAAMLGIGLVALGLGLSGCGRQDAALVAWNDVLKKCVGADQLGPLLVYFGPSNSIGPGAIWRRSDEGALFLRYELADAIPDEGQRNAMIVPGVEASCRGTAKSTWTLKPSVLIQSQLAPANGSLGVDVDRAKSATVSVNSWALDQIKEGPFEEWLKTHPQAGYVDDVGRKSRLFMERAVRLLGFSTTLEFSSDVASELKAKYLAPGVRTGEVGIGLIAKWTSNTTLELSSSAKIYIAGELSAMKIDRTFGLLGTNGATISFEKVNPGQMRVRGRDAVP